MPRTELMSRLGDLNSPTPEGYFVLLWSYFEKQGLAAAENLARSQFLHPLDLPPYLPELGNLPAVVEDLRPLEGAAFDLLALRFLTALDRFLNDRKARRFASIPLPGLDGGSYRLQRRNDYLTESFLPGVTWEADQSGSLATYTSFHKAVPTGRINGFRIDCLPESSWGNPNLHFRLLRERARLRILMWPLQTVLDYPALDDLKKEDPPKFVCLDQIRNEADLQAEVRTTIQLAHDLKTTLLILPELAIPPATEEEIRTILASHGHLGYPTLTLFGRCHRLSPRGDLDLNEAVLLGPDGTELHRHQKLTSFTGFSQDRAAHFGERLEVGDTVTVLESALGNLAPLICLDLLHVPLAGILRRSHANLFVVPSLSPQTNAHRTAAKQLLASNRAATFVCNRWISGLVEEGTSFYQLPRRQGYRPHLPDSKETSYLLFDLA